MKSRLFLDVVVRESSSIFQLLASKDQPLLVWGNSLLVLDFGFDIFNGIGWLNFKGYCLSCKSLDPHLHSTSQPKNQMKSRLFLDIVVRESSSIFQLLASKDQPLLVWGNSLLVLDFGFDIFNRIGWLNFQGNGFSCKSFHEDLHSTSQPQNQMTGSF